jgi:hypothetical protein
MLKAPAASSRLLLTERLFDCFLLASPYGEAFYCEHCSASGHHCSTLLSASPNLIGSYTFPNGTSVPAVYVVGQKSVPTEWKATGLEVTMRQYPELLPEAGVGIVSVLQQWEVMIVQYNPDGKEIADAMDRMVRRFPDAALRFTPGDDIAYERCRFVIPDMTIRRLYPGP